MNGSSKLYVSSCGKCIVYYQMLDSYCLQDVGQLLSTTLLVEMYSVAIMSVLPSQINMMAEYYTMLL